MYENEVNDSVYLFIIYDPQAVTACSEAFIYQYVQTGIQKSILAFVFIHVTYTSLVLGYIQHR